MARQLGEAPECIRVICPPWPGAGVGELRVVGVRPFTSTKAEFQSSASVSAMPSELWLLAYSDYVRFKDG